MASGAASNLGTAWRFPLRLLRQRTVVRFRALFAEITTLYSSLKPVLT